MKNHQPLWIQTTGTPPLAEPKSRSPVTPSKKEKGCKHSVNNKDSSDDEDDFDEDFSGTVVDFLDSTIASATPSNVPKRGSSKAGTLLSVKVDDDEDLEIKSPTSGVRDKSPSHSKVLGDGTVETHQLEKKKMVFEYMCVNNYLVLESLGAGAHGEVKLCKVQIWLWAVV